MCDRHSAYHIWACAPFYPTLLVPLWIRSSLDVVWISAGIGARHRPVVLSIKPGELLAGGQNRARNARH
jgi:hypothetical protein